MRLISIIKYPLKTVVLNTAIITGGLTDTNFTCMFGMGHRFMFYVLCFIQSIIITSSISYFYMVQVPILKECYVMTWIIFSKNKWPFWDSKYVKVNKFISFYILKVQNFFLFDIEMRKCPRSKSTSLCVIMFFISSPNDIGYSGITENIFSI